MGYLGSFSKSRCSREPKEYVGIRNTHIGTQRDVNCSGSQGFGSAGSSGFRVGAVETILGYRGYV